MPHQPCPNVLSAEKSITDLYSMQGASGRDVARFVKIGKWIIGLLVANLSSIGGLVLWNQRSIAAQAQVASKACETTAEIVVLRADRRIEEKMRAFALEVLQQDREQRAREHRDPDLLTAHAVGK